MKQDVTRCSVNVKTGGQKTKETSFRYLFTSTCVFFLDWISRFFWDTWQLSEHDQLSIWWNLKEIFLSIQTQEFLHVRQHPAECGGMQWCRDAYIVSTFSASPLHTPPPPPLFLAPERRVDCGGGEETGGYFPHLPNPPRRVLLSRGGPIVSVH